MYITVRFFAIVGSNRFLEHILRLCVLRSLVVPVFESIDRVFEAMEDLFDYLDHIARVPDESASDTGSVCVPEGNEFHDVPECDLDELFVYLDALPAIEGEDYADASGSSADELSFGADLNDIFACLRVVY